MSVAGSGTVRRRRPLRPEPSGPGVPWPLSSLQGSVAFSLRTQGATKNCVIFIYTYYFYSVGSMVPKS